MVNPPLDVQKYLPASLDNENYGHYEDQKEIDLYEAMLHLLTAAPSGLAVVSRPSPEHPAMTRLRREPPFDARAFRHAATL